MSNKRSRLKEEEKRLFEVRRLEAERMEALMSGEEIIDKDYVDRKLKEFENYVKSETTISTSKSIYRRIKYFFRKRPWISEVIKYSLYLGIPLSAYYFGVDKIFDTFYIGLEDDPNLFNNLEKTYDYVEFMPNDAMEVANSFAQRTGRPEVSYPVKFTLLNPRFANVTAAVLGFFLGKYFVNKRQYSRAIFIPFVTGLTLSVSYLALIPHLPTWYAMLNSMSSEVVSAVPNIIKRLIYELSSANPFVSERGLLPALLSLGGSMLSGIYSFWKRKRDISEMYNV